MSEERIIAGTGHRPESLPKKADVKKILVAIRAWVYQNPGRYVIGGARGLDTWLGLAAFNNEYEYDLVLPFPPKIFAGRWRNGLDIVRLKHLLFGATKVHIIHEEFKPSGYHDRDQVMVDTGTEIFALYDGRKKGGTAVTVGMARDGDVPITRMHPVTLEITQEGF